MYVQTGKGALSLVEVQLQGKKRMDTGSFFERLSCGRGLVFYIIVIHYK